jgi:SpoVK/Ycf46/Vps4 family AAA+-type ATPase
MALRLTGTKWIKELRKKYVSGIANAFILAGNIGDYAEDTIKVDYYLGAFLDKIMKMEEIAYYDVVNGTEYYKRVNKGDDTSRNGETLLTLCEKVKRNDAKRVYIISYPSLMIPNDGRYLQENDKINLINLHKTLNSVEFMNSENIIIFLCESLKDINPLFVSSNTRTVVIDITLPDERERESFIEILTETDRGYVTDIDNTEFSKLTAGLSLVNIEDIVLQAKDEKKLTRKMILEKKKDLIRKEYSEIIEIYDTEGFSLDRFAGQEHIKSYFKEVIINAVKENNRSIVPKGVLLMGPPGTGKTYFSRCLAGDAGINFVEFKMSKILDKWVGEAEKNLEKAFSVFRALAPVGVFIDEIDQALSRGDNDSNSVNKNLFGMFLSELSKPENRGKIIWIGATNYPNKIDEALKRSGRFDKKIPFFAPERHERSSVFKIHLNKVDIPVDKDVDSDELAGLTEGYTQAEIENIVVKALELAKRRKEATIKRQTIIDALEFMLSAQNSRIKEMEDIALLECNDLEFLPSKYRERQRKLMEKRKNVD